MNLCYTVGATTYKPPSFITSTNSDRFSLAQPTVNFQQRSLNITEHCQHFTIYLVKYY